VECHRRMRDGGEAGSGNAAQCFPLPDAAFGPSIHRQILFFIQPGFIFRYFVVRLPAPDICARFRFCSCLWRRKSAAFARYFSHCLLAPLISRPRGIRKKKKKKKKGMPTSYAQAARRRTTRSMSAIVCATRHVRCLCGANERSVAPSCATV